MLIDQQAGGISGDVGVGTGDEDPLGVSRRVERTGDEGRGGSRDIDHLQAGDIIGDIGVGARDFDVQSIAGSVDGADDATEVSPDIEDLQAIIVIRHVGVASRKEDAQGETRGDLGAPQTGGGWIADVDHSQPVHVGGHEEQGIGHENALASARERQRTDAFRFVGIG